MNTAFRIKKPALITAAVMSIFILINSAIDNRVLLAPYSVEAVFYSKYSYDGRHGNSGRGLSYSIIKNEIDGADYKVQGFDFLRLRTQANYANLRMKDEGVSGIKVGLLPTQVENLEYVVYVEFKDRVLRQASTAIKELNQNNSEDFSFSVLASIVSFIIITITGSFINYPSDQR